MKSKAPGAGSMKFKGPGTGGKADPLKSTTSPIPVGMPNGSKKKGK